MVLGLHYGSTHIPKIMMLFYYYKELISWILISLMKYVPQ